MPIMQRRTDHVQIKSKWGWDNGIKNWHFIPVFCVYISEFISVFSFLKLYLPSLQSFEVWSAWKSFSIYILTGRLSLKMFAKKIFHMIAKHLSLLIIQHLCWQAFCSMTLWPDQVLEFIQKEISQYQTLF